MQSKFWTCIERCVNFGFVIFLSKMKSLKYVNKLEFALLGLLISKVHLGFFCLVYSSDKLQFVVWTFIQQYLFFWGKTRHKFTYFEILCIQVYERVIECVGHNHSTKADTTNTFFF